MVRATRFLHRRRRYCASQTQRRGRMTRGTRKTCFGVVLFGLAGCASTPGAEPQAMSQAQHEQAAVEHEQAARCGDPQRPCWTSLSNPSAAQKVDAEKHRKMAADHRAAAGALRGAESRACVGIPDVDRDMSP